MKGQSKRGALIESIVNTVISIWIGVGVQMLIFPLFGIHGVTLAQNLSMTLIFAGTSIVRSYAIRRIANAIHVRKALKKPLN